jgi:voltage-gated potassium channel
MFKLLRYSQAVRRYVRALRDIRDELIVFFFAAVMVVFFASVGIYYFEGEVQPETFGSIFHCMWWAVVTLTTVGYGDVYPVTVGGKLFTALILIIGLGLVAVPTGLLASALTKDQKQHHEIG